MTRALRSDSHHVAQEAVLEAAVLAERTTATYELTVTHDRLVETSMWEGSMIVNEVVIVYNNSLSGALSTMR